MLEEEEEEEWKEENTSRMTNSDSLSLWFGYYILPLFYHGADWHYCGRMRLHSYSSNHIIPVQVPCLLYRFYNCYIQVFLFYWWNEVLATPRLILYILTCPWCFIKCIYILYLKIMVLWFIALKWQRSFTQRANAFKYHCEANLRQSGSICPRTMGGCNSCLVFFVVCFLAFMFTGSAFPW